MMKQAQQNFEGHNESFSSINNQKPVHDSEDSQIEDSGHK